MNKTEKEDVVADLVERLRSAETLIVADYRGLTNSQLVGLRASLRANGAQLKVVKNTLTRRAAEEVGAEALLALLEGPTAIAFVESEGDPVAVAKALADLAKETKVMSLRGGVLSGRALTGADIEELAKLPAPEVVKSQLLGVIIAPLTQLLGLLEAPVRDLVGLIDARTTQLEERFDDSATPSVETSEAPEPVAETIEAAEEPGDGAEDDSEADEADTVAEPQLEVEGEEPTAEAIDTGTDTDADTETND